MYSIIILLFIMFIIKMTIYNSENTYEIQKFIKYKYVPKSLYDYQFNKIDLINKYDNMFNKNIDFVK